MFEDNSKAGFWGTLVVCIILLLTYMSTKSWAVVFERVGIVIAAIFFAAIIWYFVILQYLDFAKFLKERRMTQKQWFESIDSKMIAICKQTKDFERDQRHFINRFEELRDSSRALNKKIIALEAYEKGKEILTVKQVAKRLAKAR